MNNDDKSNKENNLEKQLVEKMASFDKLANLGLLAMGMAHEINNAVNYVFSSISPIKEDIKNIVELLKKYEEITENCDIKEKLKEINELKAKLEIDYAVEEIERMLNTLAEGIKRTSGIVKDLQTYSRDSKPEKENMQINETIDLCLDLLANKYKNKIEIIKNYGEIPKIKAYPGKISQVFMNILINAMHAIPDKGKIYITTKMENQDLLISIKDTGVGMDEAIQIKMFDLFFTTDSVEGTGLGMPISLNIIREHNGELKVNSKQGEGTEITIRLPSA